MKFGPTLFAIDDSLRAIELGADEVPALQRFFEANTEYFMAVNGQPAQPDEAKLEFEDRPPAGMSYRRIRLIGFVDDGAKAKGAEGKSVDPLIGMATVISDFISPGVGHLGLFIVAGALHGRGVASAIYEALEHWMVREEGMQWMRLGVVVGNARAERFWAKAGFRPLRERGPYAMGQRQNLVTAMMKPLAGGSVADYLALVPRDVAGAA